MSDLDRALRDLLTDEHLDLPARPDAVRIVHDGVRRRRRHRAIAVSAATAAAVGAIAAAALVVPAALSANGPDHTTPVQPDQHYDVAWVDKPAPHTWTPKPRQPEPPSMDAPRCVASQLTLDGANGYRRHGALFTTLRWRNVSSSPCLLVGTPDRVAAEAPGQHDVIASRGLHLSGSGVGGDLQPGKLGYLTIETDRDCPARQANPFTRYASLSVTLPSGTTLDVPLPVHVQCGFFTGGLGIEMPLPLSPPDGRNTLEPVIEVPPQIRAGNTLDYVVVLRNPTKTAVSLRHCPGYVESVQAGVMIARESLGLDCSHVRSIAPGAEMRYEMRLTIPADAPSGSVLLSWHLQTNGFVETLANVTITRA